MKQIVLALLSVLFLTGAADAQPRKVVTKSGVHWTGRKPLPPAVFQRLHATAKARHGDRIEKLPKVTAAQFDCRAMGWVPPIRDQGQCGSCWNFSGSGVVTSALIKAGQVPNGSNGCSEQYTMDCGQNGGCSGDDNITVLQWAKATGLPLDKDYGRPYQADAGRCASTSNLKLYKITDWGFCTPANQQGVANTDDIKKCLVAYGPIGVGIDAGGLGDGSGIINYRGNQIDHDVIIVGWDDSKGCWIMRNSWGTGWGQACGGTEGGYCYITYGSGNIGSEACYAIAAPVVPPSPPWVFTAHTPPSLPTVPCCGQQSNTEQAQAAKAPTHCPCGGDPKLCICTNISWGKFGDSCQCASGKSCRIGPNAAKPYSSCDCGCTKNKRCTCGASCPIADLTEPAKAPKGLFPILEYQRLRLQALLTNQPLIVYAGLLDTPVPGCLTMSVALPWEDVAVPTVVVGVPKAGELIRGDIAPTVSPADVLRKIAELLAPPAARAVYQPAPVLFAPAMGGCANGQCGVR